MAKVNKMNKRDERIGETFVSNEGCVFYIKEYNNCEDVVVKFKDEHGVEVRTKYEYCKKGSVHNPYFKSLYGVGCIGVGVKTIDGYGKITREYRLWEGMLNRCYGNKEEYKSYANVTVCERWLCFANFVEDLPKIENYDLWKDNPNEGIALDKDLKQQDVENKVYSLDTVKFVTKSENSKESSGRTMATKVKAINIESGEVRYFNSIKEASRVLDVCCHTITDILRGFCYTHVKGWTFEYVEPKKAKPHDKPTRLWIDERMNPILVKERIRVGAEFRNFGTLVQVLGFHVDIKGGKLRALYKKKFEKYFSFETEGHKIIITSIYFSNEEIEEEIKKLRND